MRKYFFCFWISLLALAAFGQPSELRFPQSFALDSSYFEGPPLREVTPKFKAKTGLDDAQGVLTEPAQIRLLIRKKPQIKTRDVAAVYYENYANPQNGAEGGGLLVFQYKDPAQLAWLANKGFSQNDNYRMLYTDRYLILVWSDQNRDRRSRIFRKISDHFTQKLAARPVAATIEQSPEIQVATPVEDRTSTIGFGDVSGFLLNPEEASALNQQAGRLEAAYGTRVGFQSLPEGMNPESLPAEYVATVVGEATNRVRNHLLLLFDAQTGQNGLFYGPANGPYLPKNTAVWQSSFQKDFKEKGFFTAASTLLEKVEAAYKKVPAAKVAFLKLDVAALETKAYDFMEGEQHDSAIFYYQKLIKAFPQSSRGHFNIAWIYNTTGRQKDAIRVAQDALKHVSADQYGEFYRVLGTSYTDLKQYEEGGKYLQMALEEDPDDALSRYNLGYNFFITKNYEAAIPTLQRALEAGYGDKFNPNDTYFYLGTSLRGLGRYEEAMPYFDKAIAGSPFESYYFNKAQTLVDLERYPEAIATATEGLRHTPNSGNLYFKRAQAYRHKKEFLRAQQDLEEAARLSPDDPDVLLDMGVLYNDRNEIGKALEAYHRLLRTDSKEKDKAYSNMAGIFATNPETRDSALFYYKKAITADPENFTFYYNLGNLYREEKQYQEAIAQYQKALTLTTDEPKVYTNLASTYKELDESKEAKVVLQKGLAIAPNDYSLNALMADLVYEKDKDYPVAIQHATRALSGNPEGKHLLQLLTIRGNARQMTGAFNEALYDYLDIYKKLASGDTSGRSGALSNIGYCYLELKDWKNAEKYFDQSLALENAIDPLIGKMILYQQSQNPQKLAITKVAALKLDPRLEKGMAGLEAIEADGYFFTPAQKKVLQEVLR